MHTPKFTSIQSVTSPIFAKEIVKIRAMAIPIPENRGWVKTNAAECLGLVFNKSRFSP